MREFALTSSAAGEELEHVTRELADLRALQDAADRQTHATLTAVHETLEKVVDRLAMLEDDIMDVRGATSEQISASGPAPFFAPPQQRGAQEAVRGWDMPLDVQPDNGDFLIEPGSGFSPERRPAEPAARKPPPADPKPPARPPSASATPPLPPQTGSTQSNFIAAARRKPSRPMRKMRYSPQMAAPRLLSTTPLPRPDPEHELRLPPSWTAPARRKIEATTRRRGVPARSHGRAPFSRELQAAARARPRRRCRRALRAPTRSRPDLRPM